MAVSTESIIGKTAKLFRAGRSTSIENVSIDWGVFEVNDTRSPTVNFSRDHSSKYAMLPPMKAVQQAPNTIRGIFPGMRFSVYAIISQKNILKPKSVTLRGRFNHGGGAFEVEIPVARVRLVDAMEGAPLIHTLAARHLITEYLDERAQLPITSGSAPAEEIRKAIIIRLGEQFQLASRYTSFVAVDEGNTPAQRRRISMRSVRDSPRSGVRATSSIQSSGTSLVDYFQVGLQVISDLMLGVFTPRSAILRRERRRNLPGSWTGPLPSGPPSDNLDPQEDLDDSASIATFSTLSSLNSSGSSEWSDWTPPPSPRQRPAPDSSIPRSPSPPLQQLANAPQSVRSRHQLPSIQQGLNITAPVPEVVDHLLQLQNFDGSFDNTTELSRLVGIDIGRLADEHGFDNTIWATAVAMAFLKKRLIYQTDLYQTLFEKATEYVKDKNVDFSSMIQRAASLIQ